MGASAKKKKEKKADFAKPKLKVGKTRPKNTNATNTSFSAKSIVLKQQSVGETRDAAALFNHQLSLLSSKNETQRREALQHLTATCLASERNTLPQLASVVVAKAQPLALDGNGGVRQAFLKLLKALPVDQAGPLDQLLLYTRAGMTHLSTEIRLSALDVMDWLLTSNGEGVMACPGGWIKTLRTFQNLLGWQSVSPAAGPTVRGTGEKWTSAGKPASTALGHNKLFVHQLNTLSHFLTVGLTSPPADPDAAAKRSAELFPQWHTDAHMLPQRPNSLSYLNLFGAPRDIEGEAYDNADERIGVFHELELLEPFRLGVKEAKREGGEVGRAAASVDKSLRLADLG